MKVKICGITRVEDARAACDAGADFIGLNFYQLSPRCVREEQAALIADAVRGRARIVGVFVNAAREFVGERIERHGLDMIQFSGDEDDTKLAGWPVPVIRALRLRSTADASSSRASADLVLYDAFDDELYGGTGRALSLEKLRSLDLSRALVAGGLTPANVAVVAALKPYGVDVASGVESSPGIKDHAKLRGFIRNAKSA